MVAPVTFALAFLVLPAFVLAVARIEGSLLRLMIFCILQRLNLVVSGWFLLLEGVDDLQLSRLLCKVGFLLQ